MSRRLYWSLAVVLVAAVLAFASVGRSTKPSLQAKTVAGIRLCYSVLKGGAQTQSNTVERLVRAERNGVDLPTAFAHLLHMRASEQLAWTNAFVSHEVARPIVDAWQEPLMVCWKSNILAKASPELLNEHPVLIIWSKGANRSNEWGRGDDVFMGTIKTVPR